MSWEPIDLAKLEPRLATLPTIGGVELVYPGKRHVFSGPPESAKTFATYAIALEEIRCGGNILLVDFEMGPWDARDRLREMGTTDAELEHVFYIEPETPATAEIIESLASSWTFTLVVIDAAAGAYSLQGLDDNKRGDVERFARIYVQAFWLRGVATIVVDHVVKAAENRGRNPIGSERKLGGADVHLGFETVRALARGGSGLFRIITHKDRFGHLKRPKAAELELCSDPRAHAITWTFSAAGSADAGSWRPTHLMEKVSRWLELQPDEVSRSDVEKSVTGTGEFVRRALDELIAAGHVAERGGPRGARLNRSLSAFRESDLVGTSSAPSRDEVGHSRESSSSACIPSRGDDDEVEC